MSVAGGFASLFLRFEGASEGSINIHVQVVFKTDVPFSLQ